MDIYKTISNNKLFYIQYAKIYCCYIKKQNIIFKIECSRNMELADERFHFIA